jgi:hypothetical protein
MCDERVRFLRHNIINLQKDSILYFTSHEIVPLKMEKTFL